MKYTKCPRCGLNYILQGEKLCKVCIDEIEGRKSIFDDDEFGELICPYCERNSMGIDELMCAECRAKRLKKSNDV